MTSRQAIGTGALFYLAPNFVNALDGFGHRGLILAIVYPALLSLWGSALGWVAVRCGRPLVRGRPGAGTPSAVSRSLAETLPRLGSRQDRRLVGRILERSGRIERLGRAELAGPMLDRAASVADALAALDSLRYADASVSSLPDRALAELRREEVIRVVLRAELLRVASRLDSLCLILARAGAVESADDAKRLEQEIQELALAVESEQEVAALLERDP